MNTPENMPANLNAHTPADIAQARQAFAARLLLRALSMFGTEALKMAQAARVLVGIEGIQRACSDFADSGRVEECYTIRGALACLLGESCPEQHGSYAMEAEYGFDFVSSGGYAGAWKETE